MEALVDDLEQRGRVALTALLPGLALLMLTMWNAGREDHRIRWMLAAVLAIGIIRRWITSWKTGTKEIRHLRFTLGSTTLALMLAATIWLAFPRLTPIEDGLLGMICAGLGSAALVSMAASPTTFLCYWTPIIGSLALVSQLHPVPDHPLIYPGLAWLFLVILGALSLRVHMSLREEIFLRLKSRELAMRDSLTGLYNRRFLTEFMETETAQVMRSWSRDEGRRLTLKFLMIDLDHFKQVNDQHGHDAGDAVLEQMSALLREVLRRPDIVVRWGGEEFLIIARDAGRSLPLRLAERIRRRVAEHDFTLPHGGTLKRTCSIGFALYPFGPGITEQLNWEQCVVLADAGLYLAKKEGRDRWVGLEPGARPWEDLEGTFTAIRTDITDAVDQGLARLVRRED